MCAPFRLSLPHLSSHLCYLLFYSLPSNPAVRAFFCSCCVCSYLHFLGKKTYPPYPNGQHMLAVPLFHRSIVAVPASSFPFSSSIQRVCGRHWDPSIEFLPLFPTFPTLSIVLDPQFLTPAFDQSNDKLS